MKIWQLFYTLWIGRQENRRGKNVINEKIGFLVSGFSLVYPTNRSLLSKRQNQEEDCAKFYGLIRKAEL